MTEIITIVSLINTAAQKLDFRHFYNNLLNVIDNPEGTAEVVTTMTSCVVWRLSPSCFITLDCSFKTLHYLCADVFKPIEHLYIQFKNILHSKMSRLRKIRRRIFIG